MAWYSWPEHWMPRDFSMRILPNIRDFEGAYTPSVDVVDLLGERWVVSMSLPPEDDPIEVAAREAFFDRLKGRAHGITMSHLRLPVPQGTMRGAPTLSASAAQLANTMAITGARAGVNLITRGGLEIDQDANDLADGWSYFGFGNYGSLGVATVAGNNSARGQTVFGSAVGPLVSDGVGLYQTGVPVTAGLPYTLAADTKDTVLTVSLEINWLTSGNVFISQSGGNFTFSGGAWARRSLTATAPATAAKADIYIIGRAQSGGPTNGAVSVDNVQFEQGPVATPFSGSPTLKAGDMLGVQGQLVRVMADVQLNDAGAGTVEFQPRVRAAAGWASNSVVTVARPTANFILRNRDGVPNVWMPGFGEGPQFDLIEAW